MLLIGIHGVGNPRSGETQSALMGALANCNVTAQIREINWNEILTFPYQDGAVDSHAVRVLARRLGRASHWDSREFSVDGVRESRLSMMHELGYAGAEIAVAGMFAALTWLLPLLVTFDILQRSYAPPMSRVVVVEIFHALSVLLWISIVVFIGSGQLTATNGFRLAAFLVDFRGVLCVLSRPLVLAIYTVFVVKWWRVSEFLFPYALLPLGFATLALVWRRQWGVVSIELLVCLFLWLLTHRLMRAASQGMGSVLKVLLDIFRYIGDPSYRCALQEFVARRMKQISSDRCSGDTIIVAHSLGSVIALDYLLHSTEFAAGRVTLVTVGSPLRRFFWSFFPGLYFPSSADGCSNELAGRINRFRWLNAFRRFDYIGARIGLTSNGWRSELPTKQWFPFHTGYFSDNDAALKVMAALSNLEYSDGRTTGFAESDTTWAYRPPRHREGINATARILTYSLAFVLLCLALWNIIVYGRMDKYRFYERRLAETIEQNRQVTADVAYSRDLIGGSGHYYAKFTWNFSYRDQTNTERRPKVEILESPFRDFLDEDFWYFGKDPIPAADRDRCQSTCTFKIPILINAQNPSYFVVLGASPPFGVWSQTLTVVSHEFDALLLMVVMTIGLFIYVRPAFKALVGEQGLDEEQPDDGVETFQ
jgi:pimeloyl-ACP methyl ester carboxylesterase